MSDDNRMPKVDITKIRQSDFDFIKLVEEQNRARVLKLHKTRKNNRITAGIFGCGILGVYLYTMFAVRQEKFLDDFDEPEKTIALPN